VTRLVHAAFQALGPVASRRDAALVARALRASGDEEALALFGVGPEVEPDAPFDDGACDAVTAVAEDAGAGPFVALDLYTEMVRPGWTPFPQVDAAADGEERAAHGTSGA
jgi:hypothetical protein